MKKLFISILVLLLSSFVFAESNEEIISKFLQSGTYIKYCLYDETIYINKISLLSVEIKGKWIHLMSNGGKFCTNAEICLYIDSSEKLFTLDEYNNLIITRK